MQWFKRLFALTIVIVIAGSQAFALADAVAPYQSYTYDYRENVVITPPPYLQTA